MKKVLGAVTVFLLVWFILVLWEAHRANLGGFNNVQEVINPGGSQTITGLKNFTGGVAVNTTTPKSLLHVDNGTTVTTTVWGGNLNGGKGQLCLGDAVGGGKATCFYFNNGTLVAFTTTTY